MIAMQPPYSALNPDREGGILARTTLRFRVIFDEADILMFGASNGTVTMSHA
jgi:hypothetical protein